MSDAQIVYASPDRLFVATQRWFAPQLRIRDQAPPTTTQINAFDTSDPGQTTYAATARSRASCSTSSRCRSTRGSCASPAPRRRRGGRAATRAPARAAPSRRSNASSLQPLGRVGGLGQGERIFAVRFVDDVGYVVTFRQVDPLYVLDLSKPAEPRVNRRAEGRRLLGLPAPDRQGPRPRGRPGRGRRRPHDRHAAVALRRLRPANPQRLAQHAIGGANSSAEYDHHAFLYWPATKLAVVPLTVYDGDAPPFVGAVGLRVTRTGIDEVGRIEHPHETERCGRSSARR